MVAVFKLNSYFVNLANSCWVIIVKQTHLLNIYHLSGKQFVCFISFNPQSKPMRLMLLSVIPILLMRTQIQKGELTCLRLHCDRASQPKFLLHFLFFLPCCHPHSKECGLFLKGCNLEEKKYVAIFVPVGRLMIVLWGWGQSVLGMVG